MGWAPGTHVGSYEVLAFLGNGGMGEVYKVRHVISRRLEAVKVLLKASSQKPELAQRFEREIRVLADLNHPNIATLHTAFRHDDQLIMVMEYVEGMNLSELLARGLKIKDTLTVIRQVLSALEYAHSRGVIHRDIKPSNVMINAAGKVKLLDFGLARVSTPDSTETSSQSLLGSVHYISPEQIRGEPMDVRSDLYALGVTLYEMVTGKLPIQGSSVAEIISGHLTTAPAAPASVNASVPEELSEIVMRALQKKPDDRFQSSAEFLAALESVKTESSSDLAATIERTLNVTVMPSPQPASSGGSGANKYNSDVLDDISQQLAQYIGPIAKIVVRRASASSANLRELCDKVAQEIDSENYRKTFLSRVRKHFRAASGF